MRYFNANIKVGLSIDFNTVISQSFYACIVVFVSKQQSIERSWWFPITASFESQETGAVF